MKMTQGQISAMNKRFINRRNRDLEEEEAAAQAAEIDAQNRNAAQPKGKWDAGSQTWIPKDPTHGKASRKWNPGGVNPWSGAIDQQREEQESDMYGVALADQIGLRSSADDTFAAIQQETARRQQMANNVIGVVMSQARMRFGGQITPELANWANGVLGADANSGMVGGGRQKDGSFVIKMADGSVIPFSVQSQIGMAYQMPGTSTDDDRAGLLKAGQLSGIPKNVLAQLTRNPFDSQVIQKNAENIIRQRYLSEQEEGRRNILRRSKNPDSVRARGGFGDGSAGGRNIGSVDVPGNVARRLFGLGGDNRSRISFFGTSGRPGDGWSERVYDGHTGEDTGFVNFEGRREAELDREAERQERVYRAKRVGIYGSPEDRISVEDAKHRNKMEELRLQEDGKTTRSAAKRDFDQKKLDATIKKWGDDLKVREKSAKTAEDKAALEKSRAQYNDYSKRIGVLSNALNSPYMPEDVKDQIRQKIAAAVNDDGTPNYEALAGTDNQAPIKPGDNTGDETDTGSEPPDGKYTIEKDGVSYHWGKSKNGGWKYFPDKK